MALEWSQGENFKWSRVATKTKKKKNKKIYSRTGKDGEGNGAKKEREIKTDKLSEARIGCGDKFENKKKDKIRVERERR